jgi:hypothetical protein
MNACDLAPCLRGTWDNAVCGRDWVNDDHEMRLSYLFYRVRLTSSFLYVVQVDGANPRIWSEAERSRTGRINQVWDVGRGDHARSEDVVNTLCQ